MPQLNPEFFVSQLFWLTITFAFLFVFLWKISLPRIKYSLEKRQNKINDDLSEAKKLQDKANEIEKTINEKLSKAKNESDEKIRDAMSSMQENITKELSSIDKELEIKISNAEKTISENKKEQMDQITDEMINITKMTVTKIANINVSEEDISKALNATKAEVN